jgi:hypothetical protein
MIYHTRLNVLFGKLQASYTILILTLLVLFLPLCTEDFRVIVLTRPEKEMWFCC